jgi:hypothetical protein
MREYQLDHGVPRAQVYDITAYILCGLLAIGVICNAMIKPVAEKNYMTEAELEAERRAGHESATRSMNGGTANPPQALAIAAWLAVGIPLAWGVWITLEKALVLFR